MTEHDTSELPPTFIAVGHGPLERPIAVRARTGGGPGLFWLGGFHSDMKGTKAVALDAWAAEHNRACVRFDYSGHGESGGAFDEGTIGRWLEESLAVFDRFCEGPQIVIGSSMGGWIALHLALLRQDRVKALIGIAAASDFTKWGFADGDTAERQGLSRAFWESGQELLLLDHQIAIDCPVRLLHGELDRDVPLGVAFRTMQALRSADVQLVVLKGSGHRLSEPHEIDAILRTVTDLLEPQI